MMKRTRIVVAAALVFATASCASSNDSAQTATTVATKAPAKLDQLRVYHPETLAFAAPFAMIDDDSGPLARVASDIEDSTWSTPDILRGLLVGGKSDVTAVPTYVGANLANKGVDVKLAAVTVWGLLYVIGPDGAPKNWDALRGQTVMVPFPNDMPDLVFQHLARANGLEPGKDFTIETYAKPMEAVMRLVAGKGTWAVLPEHVATVAMNKAKQNGHELQRTLNLQDEWAAQTGGSPRIPQAGIVVPDRIAQRGDVLGAILDELDAAVATVNAADKDTVADLADEFKLPAPIIADVIPRLNLDVVPAAEARHELETFFRELSKGNKDIIGGKLPPADFYLADPR